MKKDNRARIGSLEIASRYILPLFSFTFIILEMKVLQSNEFNNLMIAVSLAGWILWFSDFGLTSYATLLSTLENFNEARRLLIFRFTSLSIILMFASGISVFSNFNFVILFTVTFDLFFDILLNLRAQFTRNNTHLLFMLIKKLVQITILALVIIINIDLSLTTLGFIVLVPNIILIINDLKIFSKIGEESENKTSKKDLLLNWIQGGGVTLAGLDILILNRNMPEFIATYVLAKRLTNFLSSGSPAFLADTLKSDKIYSLKKYLFLVFLMACLGCLFFAIYLDITISAKNRTSDSFLIFSVVLLLTPLGIINFHQNTILVKYSKFRVLILINWCSSIIYLLIIMIFDMKNIQVLVFLTGYALNLIIEFVWQKIILRNYQKMNIEK